MHHYPHYIKAFKAATAHLTRVQRSLYREAIDLYYDLERAWDSADFDGWAHKLQARTDEEKADLRLVQREFFPELEGTFRNERCDKEIHKYQGLIASASAAGKASAEKRKNAKETGVQRPLPPRSTNQNQNQNHLSTPNGVDAASGSTTKRATRLPETWEPSESGAAFIRKERPDLDPKITADLFRDYWAGKGGKDGCKLDWEATWRNWVRQQRALPGGASAAKEWWESKSAILAKGLELVIPAPADSSDAAWYEFMAAVWVAAGDGPWINPESRAYPIYKRLRNGGGE